MFPVVLFVALLAIATPSQADDCSTTQVISGDSCGALASRCGISASDFTTFNPDPQLCATLQPGQYVCCSAGTLPDRSPQPNADGSCSAYTVQPGDYCALIAANNSITLDQINQFNTLTWGWDGCDNLQAEEVMCLSSGTPPMPAPIQGATCGPQMPGTQQPSPGTTLADLNPCPLNVCCNKWGQCGTTSDFCVPSNSSTGNPGTSAPGTNGCISNCGMAVVQSGSAPASFNGVGYFESWSINRPCLQMDASQIDGSAYDVVHFGFAALAPDFTVNTTGVDDQLNVFLQQSGFKKVVSFGGWSFSTDPSTYSIFRQAVTAANRGAFAQNIANFIQNNSLDGVDFDWEYPGAPDIPGIPPGDPDDGANYLAFLTLLRSTLGPSKTISIAAPASYWYLKQFPIAAISSVVDYIIYMTYDLHGQWDYGNKWAAEGCPGGSCLRSHINYTETVGALAMITKAGVPGSKVVVGIASYGRGFQMAQSGCDGPMCTFTGPASGATPGNCTATAGYLSNAEINDVITKDPTAATHYDQGSDSIILEYGGDQWVAFMDDNTRKSRLAAYASMGFAGTSDWAIDLVKYYPAPAPAKNPNKGTTLAPQSTCNEVENAQAALGVNGPIQSMWNDAGTSQVFSDWVSNWTSDNAFAQDFAAPWGLGAPVESWKITDIGTAPSCSGMAGMADAAGSGPAYLAIYAMYNLLDSLSVVYQAITIGQNEWSSLQTWWNNNFDTSEVENDPLLFQEIVNAIAAAVGIVLSLTAGPVGAAVAAAAGGIANAMILADLPNEDTSSEDLGNFELAMATLVQNMTVTLEDTFDTLRKQGQISGLNFQTALADGAWLDPNQIPLLNLTTSVVNAVFQKHINAAAVNWAWHNQRVWLMSYPMAQSDFDSNQALSGNNDDSLKLYHAGIGYYLMSVAPGSRPASPFEWPVTQNPPGYDIMNQEPVNIDPHDVIQSSADGFWRGGYGYNPVPDLTALITDPQAPTLTTNSVALPGIFNIPVCPLNPNYGWTPDLPSFFASLSAPGDIRSNGGHGAQASFCFCLGIKDQNGVLFDDQIDVANWHGGQNPQCLGYNTVGGGKMSGKPSTQPTHIGRDAVVESRPVTSTMVPAHGEL